MESPESISVEQLAAQWVQAQPAIAAYVSSLIPDFHDASDVLQEVGMVAVRKREEYDPARPFVAWAIGIAHLEVLKHRRTAARSRLQFSERLIESMATTYKRFAPDLDGRRQAVEHCLKQAKGQAAAALKLRYAEGLGIGEIATQLDTSETTVRSTLYRVRKALHDCVERYLRRNEVG